MPLFNTLRQFNWIDVFFVILLIRICYVAIKSGFPSELFRLLGTISAIYVSLHYYVDFSGYLVSNIGSKNLSPEYLSFYSFVALAALGYLVFALIGRLFSRFIHMEAVPSLNKWGSFILGIIRSFLFISLIIFMFAIAPTSYFKNSVRNSYTGERLSKIAPATYTWIWDSIMSKFRAQEKFNSAILKVQESLVKE